MDPRKPGVYTYGRFSFDHEPFYVGKGTGYRYHAHATEARRYLKDGTVIDPNEMAKVNRLVDIFNEGLDVIALKVIEGLNEFESFEHETDLIGTIGRVARNMGPLVNENDGTQFVGPQPVKLISIKGMNNVSEAEGDPTIPRVVLNADITANGRAVKRGGYMKKIPLPGAHSLYAAEGVMLVAAKGILYRIRGGELEVITNISGPDDEHVCYTAVDGRIFVSNSFFCGVFDPSDNSFGDIGIPLPDMPIVVPSANGSLLPGVYRVCFTNVRDGLYGGNGAYADINLSDGGGIEVINRMHGQFVWCTDPNGDTFYRCGEVDFITSIDTVEPLSTYRCYPPNPMHLIAYEFGRLWASVGNQLYYSEPYRPDLFKQNSFFSYNEEITMIAPVTTQSTPGSYVAGGIYVGLKSRTIFLAGSNPAQMVERNVGSGAIKGSLAYCQNVPDLGNNIPAWIATDGVVIGDAFGNVKSLTAERVRIAPGSNGAALFRMAKGTPQLVASYRRGTEGSGMGFGDSATCEVIRNGKVL